MIKNYILYGICFMLLIACDREDVNLKETEVIDWFAIKDKPGELGHLLYDIYERTGVSIFVNDTLGYMDGGTDVYGNPVKRYETVSEKYLIYNSLETDIRFVLSSDTAAMLKAARAMEKWVIPNMAPRGEYRSKSFLLVDSLLWEEYGGDTIREGGGTAWAFDESIETTPVGKLADIKNMDESTLKFWAGMALSAKVYTWLNANYSDLLNSFYKLTNSDVSKKATLYNLHSFWFLCDMETGELLSIDDRYEGADFWDYWRMGFLEWVDTEYEEIVWFDEFGKNMKKIHRKAPSKLCDAMSFIAAVYAYSDEEFEALFEEVEYREKCINKRLFMKDLVQLFEDEHGITRQPFN